MTPERRSVTGIWTADGPVDPLIVGYTKPLLAAATQDGRTEVVASGIRWTYEALPAEPTEPAGALDRLVLADALGIVAKRLDLVELNRLAGTIALEASKEYARLTPSEPRADSEGLREALEWLGTDIECAQHTAARPKNADYERWRETVRELLAALRREQPAAEQDREVERG